MAVGELIDEVMVEDVAGLIPSIYFIYISLVFCSLFDLLILII